MKEADRKLAGAFVLAAWSAVACAIVAGTIGAEKVAPAVAAAPALAAAHDEDVIHAAALTIERESRCLAEAIYHEARSESAAGQMAVADVVINRVVSERYPDTICDVVYQGSQRRTGCQFSFTCDGSLKKPVDVAAWNRAERLARNIVLGHRRNVVGEATHYHADYVDPYWSSSLERERKVGRHIFYTDAAGAKRG